MISWHIAYRELAELLNRFYILNGFGSGMEFYKKCSNDLEFSIVNNRVYKFYDDFKVNSIDPIHVFASLNESGYGESSRINRLNNFFKILDSDIKYKEIDFTGCPSPFSIKIMAARNGEVQLEVWNVFNDIVRLGQDGLNQNVFDKIKNWYGVDVSSFTMFLFWIDSDNFLPIDKNTNKFLIEKNIYKKRPRNYAEYKRIIPSKKTDLYRKMARFAYNPDGVPIILSEYIAIIDSLTENKIAEEEEEKNVDFKLLAIKASDKKNIGYLKVLKQDYPFVFYKCYDFTDEAKIKYIKNKDFGIYNINEHLNSGGIYNLDINISAIVGKNGSGKSSITELLYMAINNLTYKALGKDSGIQYIDDLHIELYYHTDTIYKLIIDNDNVSLIQFNKANNVFEPKNEVKINKDCLEDFFHTIAINYSHFALNALDMGDWINELFYKNDGYQAPIVINPMRTDGNIDINLENSFAKSRMLSNILEPIEEGSNISNLRQITDNGRIAKGLKLTLNLDKVDYLYKTEKKEIVPFPPKEEQKIIIDAVYSFFKISINNVNEITDCANKYIYKKLVNISKNYKRYYGYYIDNSITPSRINEYLEQLQSDPSHITYKIKQAINYLKHEHLKYKETEQTIDINQLSNDIQKVIENNYSSITEFKVIELVPPSFFKVDIILNDGTSFDKLSSGEKQRIHSINSLVYHITNLDSVYDAEDSEEKNVKYSFVNVLFDEIELYFHPDMQRTFVSYLRDYLKKIKLNYIDGLNFCFITHSPFILSDIPSENVMFLKKEDENNFNSKSFQLSIDETKTFGANVHELLATGFFLDNGFMGEFAKEKIKSAISYLENQINRNSDKKSENDLRFEFVFEEKWTKEIIASFIDTIGEPLIKKSLKELYNKAFINTATEIDNEIKRLQKQKESLKTNRNDSNSN